MLVAAGDDQHFLRLAESVRQNDRAADHLVGVLGIDAEAHVHFDGLIELGELDLLNEGRPLRDRRARLRPAQQRPQTSCLFSDSLRTSTGTNGFR